MPTPLVVLVLALAQEPGLHAHTESPQGTVRQGTLDVPSPDVGAETLAARAKAQEEGRSRLRSFTGFRFTDRQPESGINFMHQIVDDAGKTYKAAHYDHGNGLAVADIDGDGRYDLFFSNQLGESQLWRNLGGGRFDNVTRSAGLALPGRIGVSASFADLDNDGDQDLYLTTVRGGNVLYENDGKGRFKDISKGSALDYVGHSSSAVFFDYDRDGRLDCFLVNVGKYTTEVKGRGGYFVAYEDAFSGHLFPARTETSVLYRNLGGNRFADVSAEVGLVDGSWSGDATVADFNRDGWPDLYVLNMQGDDHYYENVGGKVFVDKSTQLFPRTPWGAMGVKAFDYDNDGDQDLLITDMHSDMFENVGPERETVKSNPAKVAAAFLQGPENNLFGNAFYENQGNGTFRERSDALGLENYWPWGVSVDDVNADGFEDVLIAASMNYPFRYGINSLLLNEGGTGFAAAEFLLGVEPRRGGSTRKPWFTLDCSGADQARKECAGQNGEVTVTGTLGTRSAAIFDLDDDGDLDIVTNELNSAPQVLISDLAAKRPIHFLELRLVGSKSNRNGLGARVTVTAGSKKLVRFLDGQSGYLSHSVLPLYFGLGEAKQADGIEILWPSGTKQLIPGPLAANQTLEVKEADAR